MAIDVEMEMGSLAFRESPGEYMERKMELLKRILRGMQEMLSKNYPPEKYEYFDINTLPSRLPQDANFTSEQNGTKIRAAQAAHADGVFLLYRVATCRNGRLEGEDFLHSSGSVSYFLPVMPHFFMR